MPHLNAGAESYCRSPYLQGDGWLQYYRFVAQIAISRPFDGHRFRSAHYHKASMMQWQRLANHDAHHQISAAPRFVVFRPTHGGPQSLPPGLDLEVAHLRDENPNLRGKGLQIHIRHILVKKVIKTLRNLLGVPVEIVERH